MDGRQALGLGDGMMRGLELYRRHKREDQQDAQRQEQLNREQQRHDLAMKSGEQAYRFGEKANPIRLEGLETQNSISQGALEDAEHARPFKRRAIERGDKADEMRAWAAETSHKAKRALMDFESGNYDGVNTFFAGINPNSPYPPVILPPTTSGDPGMLTAHIGGQDQDMSRRDVYEHLLAYSNPDRLIEIRLAGDESADWRNAGDDVLYNQRTGEHRVIGSGGGVGRSGYGGMKPSDWNQLDGRNTAFFGRLDETGQIILDGEAKHQKDMANTRTMELIGQGVPAWRAEIISRASVGGTSSASAARKAADGAAFEAGVEPGDEGYEDFIANYIQESDATGQQEAEALYRQLTGQGSQSYGLPPATGVSPEQQPQAATLPTIDSEQAYNSLPSGARFVNPADGKTYIKP